MTYRLPPLNGLRAFEAAARHMSFKRAADELGVTAGAVSQHIKALETALDVPLFRRLARSIELSAAGRSKDAEAAYRTALERTPGRAEDTEGLARARAEAR